VSEPLPLLVDPAWLHGQQGAADLRVIDASWYLPDAGRDPRAEFASGHIPGAVYLDLSSDLADPRAPLRNTVASPEALAARFSVAGIGREHRVVVYDRRSGYSAGRIWWCLRYAGHDRVALLDGGFERWAAEGRPVEQKTAAHPPAPFEARPEPRWLARRGDVLAALAEGRATVVDVRTAERFRGEGVEHAPRRGHMPRARNVPYPEHWSGSPALFQRPAALRRIYARAGVDLERPIITTCGSGVTASLAAFALTLAGQRQVRVYDGSWAEWASDPALPVELGPPRPR
jgi:thiosulfate/3-mercaptopyruvate sulfurtransferase